MKKTQSLKLMLLGLFALVSGSASAKVGEVFSDGMFIYQELEGNGAKIIAINDENGLVVIPDKCYNNFDIVAGTTQGKELSVVALDDEWYAQVKVQLIKVVNGVETNYGSPMATLDLTSDAAPAFELDILATQLKTISTEAIQPLNKKITKFVVAENAGLTNIPDFAFANCKVTVVANEQAAGIQAAIDNLTNQIKLAEIAIASEPGYWVLNGKYVVNNSVVYYVGDDADGKAILVILGEEAGKDPEGTTPASTEKPVYKLLRINPDGTTSAYKDADNKDVVARPNSAGDKLVYNAQTVAYRTQQGNEEKELKYYPTLFVQSLAADQAYNTLAGAKNDYINGESYATLKQALDMKNLAINPDVINSAAYWKKLAAQVHPYWIYSDYDNNGESVSYNVTPAIEAALLAGNMSQLTSEADRKRYKEVWDAMVLAGWPTTTTNIPATAATYVKGAVFNNGTEGYSLNGDTYKEGENSWPILAKTEGEDTKYLIKEGTGTDIKYYEATVGTPATEATTTTGFAVPNWTKIEADWQDAVTAQENAQKALDEACAYDPDGEAGEAACMTLAELDEAIGKALTAKNAANTALTNKTTELANLKGQKEGKENELEGAVKNSYEVIADNEVLQNVEWNNEKIKTFGQSAFERCTKAAFDNKVKNDKTSLPATTETVGAKAFKNTGIDAGLYYANANIKSIGDEAFANTNTTYVNLQNATQLTDKTFGAHVFDNCPVKVIKLQNTQLTGMPVGLAENIKRTEPVTDCDGKYIGKPLSGSAGELQHYTIAGTDWNKEENLAKLYLANTTLETVDMPKGAKGIRDFGFAFCESLATITIPATVTAIGNYALAGTALQNLNLEHLTDLQTVGQGAFAYNTSMQYVYFAKTAPFDNLMGDVFKCDASLTTIKLNDDIKCLEAGLFAGTAVEKLDLSKTQLTVLEDLFQATETNVNSTFKYIKLPKPAYDWYTGVETRPGLQIIRDHALANLVEFVGWEYETGKYRFELPSSVWCMGTYVFYNDKKLTEFYAMDSKLTNLGVSTFNSCEKLEKVTMVTLNIIDPAWTSYGRKLPKALAGECYPEGLTFDGFQFNFDDMQFFGCKKPTVIVTEESKDNLKAYYQKSYPNEYSTLDVFHPTLTLGSFGGSAYSSTYYNYDYATWIPVDQATVYTAYQDLDKVYIYRAKHQNGFYKIPQATRPNFRFTSHEVEKADGTKEDVLDLWVNDRRYPSVYQGTTSEGGVFTPSVDNLGQKQILSALSSNYIFANDDVRRPQNSAAVIIISDKETINIERHTKPLEVNQSTLDRDNELRITGTCFESGNDLPISKCVHAWYYNGNADDANFTKVNGKVPANQVVMHLSDFQGTAGGRIQVVFVDDDMSTGIKDYIQKNKLNEGAIYNMQGIRVKSTVKGQMYIQNGKKFIQK